MNILTTAQKSNEAIQEEAKALASSMHMAYIKKEENYLYQHYLMLIHVILLLFFLVMT